MASLNERILCDSGLAFHRGSFVGRLSDGGESERAGPTLPRSTQAQLLDAHTQYLHAVYMVPNPGNALISAPLIE